MLRSIILILLSFAMLMPANAEEGISNPTNNPVIGFINKEKFRVKVRDLVDRYQNPEKYQNTEFSEEPFFQSVEGEVGVTLRNLPESEVHAAISPINPDIMVISPILQNPSHPTNTVTCPVYYSTNRGVSWSQSTFITKPYSREVQLAGGGDPVLVFDANGDLYFSWINLYLTYKGGNPDSIHAALFWARSSNGGVTFEFDEENYFGNRIFSGQYTNQVNIPGMLDKQWMAADYSNSQYRNSVYTSSLSLVNSGFMPELRMHVYRKRGGDKQFERTPAVINTSSLFIVQFGCIDTDSKGNVHLTFYGSNGISQSLYHCVSTNGGVSFSNPVKISDLIGSMRQMQGTENVPGISTDRMYPAPYMVVDRSGGSTDGNIYIAWSASGINSRSTKGMEIFLSRSTDAGKSWSAPKQVNNDGLDGVHNFYSNIAINNKGVIAVSWYDTRENTPNATSALTHYYIGISHDGGQTFSNHKVSSQPSNFRSIGFTNNGFGIGEYNAIMMTDDYAYPVWGDGRTNNGNVNIYMAKVSLDQSASSVVEDILPVNEDVKIVSVSPNPANEYINIEYSSNTAGSILEVVDISGKVVVNLNISENKTGVERIDISKIPVGNYFIRISSNYSYSVKQFNIIR